MKTSTRFVARCQCGAAWSIGADGVTYPITCGDCGQRFDARAHGDTITITTYGGTS